MTNNKVIVSIMNPKPSERFSSLSSIKKFDKFTLALHSAKSTYDQNEPIQIWATLSCEGDEKAAILDGSPMLSFSIEDQDGIREGGYMTASAIQSELTAGNQVMNDLPLHSIADSNFRKSGMTDRDAFWEHANENQALLPPGTYIIQVYTSFLKGEGLQQQQSETTQLQINVKR